MMEQLQQGINLVVDRYAYSGVAFSSAKQVITVTLAITEMIGCILTVNEYGLV